ncbi:hypothetical protein FVEN_g6906 [Fusarium venenatum]|uniref:Uncharacterized protein n=1 Tax=Fusarium venenatum TaxID=56646 RepID=A0A2L2U3K3_9HYPO|nr:uncharacterized protein FVRRES_09452 [Fusarium venenatum]KAG8355142.1 hypothetical protein FVEN_g6906 [Fusarium venenatum]CEI69375.1 unnamed protein product [Fusarium venenatum]
MAKRHLNDDSVARKRHKPTTDHHQPQLSPLTIDVMPRLHSQRIYEEAEGSYNKGQRYLAKGDANLREMLPTSDGRDMKYEHFTPVQHESVNTKTFDEAIVRVREFERKERLWEEEKMACKEKCGKQARVIQDLKKKISKLNRKIKHH